MKPALGSVPVGMIVLQLAVSMAHAAEEMPAEIIAAQIRDQGYACDKATQHHERWRTLGRRRVDSEMPKCELQS